MRWSDANAAVAPAYLTAQLGCRVRRIVIYKYDLPLDSRKRVFQAGDERPNVLTLVQGRDDHGQFQHETTFIMEPVADLNAPGGNGCVLLVLESKPQISREGAHPQDRLKYVSKGSLRL